MAIKFISRNYMRLNCGGAIAKSDIEIIMENLGYENIGLGRTYIHNGLVHGLRNFIGLMKAMASIRKGDVIVLQYPMKMFFDRIVGIAHSRGAKVVCLIHDLDSFRDKTLTPPQEMLRLNRCDVLLTHNYKMRQWLSDNGCTVPMVDYVIMDYIHGESASPHVSPADGNYSLFYVGNVSYRLHSYLYKLAALMPERQIYLYGTEADMEKIETLSNLHYEGFVTDTELMARHKGDFGLSWYGHSLDDGAGNLGEYMAYNNPHKVSLYFRSNAPVILWSGAGRARFVEEEGLGIAVDSLKDLDRRLNEITPGEYRKMTAAVETVNARLKTGEYLREAMEKALSILYK